MAGLVAYYNTGHWYYIYIMGDEDGQSKNLQITSCDNFEMNDVLDQPIKIEREGHVKLKIELNRQELQFSYAFANEDWVSLEPSLDASILSDDYVRDGSSRYRPAFTGCFVGICCQDLTGHRRHADFDWFAYKELK